MHSFTSRSLVFAAAVSLALIPAAAAAASPVIPNSGPAAGGTPIASTVDGVVFTEFGLGRNHTIALGTDGNAYAWGLNLSGQLGDGTTTDRPTPALVQTPPGVTFTQVSAGAEHSLAVGSDGNTYSWGSSPYGALGDGPLASRLTPGLVRLPLGVTFTKVSAGYNHSLALGSDGNAYAWGHNNSGQLGEGTTTSRLNPKIVIAPSAVTFTEIAGGSQHSVALASDGTAYAWGRNSDGQLGDGTLTAHILPAAVVLPSGVSLTDIGAGSDHAVGVGSNGSVYAWGNNDNGQLGDLTTTNRLAPVRVEFAPGIAITEVSTALAHSTAVGSDNTIYAWGLNTHGELGDSTTTTSPTPLTVDTPAGVTLSTVTSGGYHSMALGSDNKNYAWGWNALGQLGDGTTTDRLSPTVIAEPTPTAVLFGTTAATNFVATDNSWRASSPAGLCGPVDVTVQYEQFGRAMPDIVTPNAFTFGAAPVVTTDPSPASTVFGGGNVTASAAASGDVNPTVQWQSSTTGSAPWSNVVGATTATVTVPLTEPTHLRAVFTNCFGPVNSSAALFSITATGAEVDGQATAATDALAATGSASSGLLLPAVGLLALGWIFLFRNRLTQHGR
ncbi:MAG: RCC1 domain-containing protein [Rhodoglobus sp.]